MAPYIPPNEYDPDKDNIARSLFQEEIARLSVEHLQKKESEIKEMPIAPNDKHPFWNSWIGRAFGGDSAVAAWRVLWIFGLMWGVQSIYSDLRSTYAPLPQQVRQLQASQDSLVKTINSSIGDPKDESRFRTQSNISYRIVNKHFPADVARARQEMSWGASVDNGN